MNKPCSRRSCLLALLLAASAAGAGAWAPVAEEDALRPVPENWEARSLLRDIIFASVRDAASAPRRIVAQTEASQDVLFEAVVQDGAAYLVFANRRGKGFPVDSAGTFIIKRDLRDGSFSHAKVFVQNDPGCYLRLFPQDDRTAMDIVLFNEVFQRHVIVPAPFSDLLTSPFSRIMELTRSSVDWPLVVAPARGPGDARLEAVVKTLRGRLRTLRDMDDGAMDASGRLVFIATGNPAPAGKGGFNCSGFAKWVVDGFYQPLVGAFTDINSLRSRDSDLLGKAWSSRYEEEQDPYFGLDWSRALARNLAYARAGRMPGPDSLDVMEADRFEHVKDVGYSIERLPALLYFLARERPGTFYLGSVNGRAKDAPPGSSMLLRQHHHVIVLFPFFDEAGEFHPVVMERNRETSLSSLERRYPGEYVNLVRVDSSGEFIPPEPPR